MATTESAAEVARSVLGADVRRHPEEKNGDDWHSTAQALVRASADLSVYIRQHHGDRDLARLGVLKARREREAENDLSKTPDPAPH